jgi:thiamine kinase-like enzyme
MFVLSSQNVANYLEDREIYFLSANKDREITLKHGKNFNLLVKTAENNCVLVKQERLNDDRSTSEEFVREWRIQEWLNSDLKLESLRQLMPEVVDFDRDNAIVVIKYYSDCQDLDDFYRERQVFPESVATALGESLAAIHSRTFNSDIDHQFLQQNLIVPQKFLPEIGKLSPNIFGIFCEDGIEFFRLYQRHDSLKESILQLHELWHSCCLCHGDLKLDNILIRLQPQKSSQNLIRFIDWEKYCWGDPTYDLAMIIESYLKIWLESLLISPAIDINTSLQLANTPLEKIQPSLRALITSYLTNFTQVIADSPKFCQRLMQLTGYITINKIIQNLESHYPFDNRAICTLQVAKTLLCRPQEAFSFVFGRTEAEIIDSIHL